MRKVILTALLLTCTHAYAKRNLDTASAWDWRTIASPQITPDGKSVLYVLSWSDKMNDVFYSNLWSASIDGKEQRPVTQGAFRDSSPRISPDGKRVAYLSNRSGKPQIHIRWLDSGQEAAITDLEQAPSNIAWSPDGKWIAYTARVPAKPAWSVHMPEKPVNAKWAEPPIVITRLHWRQDGSGLVRPGNMHVFVVPAIGGTPRQITSGDYDHQGEPAWTPDGEYILMSSQRGPDAEYSLAGGEIYSFRVKDGEMKQLTKREGPDLGAVVSPDGKKIAYTGFDFKHQSYTVTHLYVMDRDGGNPKRLAADFDRDVHSPHWAADSREIYFAADDRGAAQMYAARLDGTYKAITTGRARFSSGYATTDAFSVSLGGQVAIVRSSPRESSDIVTFAVSHPDRITRITQSNDSLLADRELGDVEEITYDSFDGKPIQGWIIKPPQFDASKKYPLILDIHGGPHAMFGTEFQQEFQIYAGRGFVVLYTNPRGSTGYGEEFGNIIHTKYPGDDFKDLMTGVDVMIAKGYIDPKRLAVTGGSGGGLLTAWAIGHTDRFAAAVSQYPVTNWITQVGTADGGYTHAASWMTAMPWEKPQQYLEHSPIFFAQNFKTPTMIISGLADLRTPSAQSEELYFALKARKVPAVLIEIPDEPHGIRGEHPSHRIAKMEHILGWIEKWTNTSGT